MKILSIETSCDDTSIAIIEARGKKRVSFDVLSNVVSSQVEIHKKWGGVYPTLAKREHQKNLTPVLRKALEKAGMFEKNNTTKKNSRTLEKILEREPEMLKDFLKLIPKIKKPRIRAITVTIGPGLEPCLWMGINFARALSYFWEIPIMPINHIEGHIYANFIDKTISKDIFPAMCLIVSGGHTQLILMSDYNKYEILGETRDDAAGECLDKVARILGLEYPGGPIIEKRASMFKKHSSKKDYKISLPRPMIYSKNYDFSFSGLKTAALYDFKKRKPSVRENQDYVNQMCSEIQQSIIDVLVRKSIKAAKDYQVETILLGGGVTANKELRKQIKKAVKRNCPDKTILLPTPRYCTDNAAMTAIASYFHYLKGEEREWKNIKANSNLRLD